MLHYPCTHFSTVHVGESVWAVCCGDSTTTTTVDSLTNRAALVSNHKNCSHWGFVMGARGYIQPLLCERRRACVVNCGDETVDCFRCLQRVLAPRERVCVRCVVLGCRGNAWHHRTEQDAPATGGWMVVWWRGLVDDEVVHVWCWVKVGQGQRGGCVGRRMTPCVFTAERCGGHT